MLSTAPALPVFPATPADYEDYARMTEQALRYRILYGGWIGDVRERVAREIGKKRADEWGIPDISANLLNAATSAVSVLYDRKPKIYGRTKPATKRMEKLLEEAGWAQLMQRVQRDTIAIREMFLHPYMALNDDGSRSLRIEMVHPHLIQIVTDPYDYQRIVKLYRWQVRDGAWTRDVFELEPVARYSVDDGYGNDLSPNYLTGPDGRPAPAGGLSGDRYPWRDQDGPYLPWIAYHAAETGRMWDWPTLREVSEATLNVAAAWTYWRHILHNASWPQRYVAGLEVAGMGTGDHTEDRYIEPDPTLILRLVADTTSEVPGQGFVGQFETAADLHKIGEAIQAYERRALAYAGLSPSEVMRSSGDPRSGYALAVSRDGQRESQRKYGPIFQRYDQQLLALIARMDGALPVDGWEVEYEMLPPSAAEMREQRDNAIQLMQAGLMSRVDAYMSLHPSLSRAEAERQVAEIEPPQTEESENARRARRPEADEPDPDDG